ncbi:MAG: hypothetical protein HQL32_11910 [Planctomycetes bacterium]|nr:hypothetical protein [Planctomycetota bacterium]
MTDTKNDPWLIGHFTDNELCLSGIDVIRRYLKNPKSDSGHQAAVGFTNSTNTKSLNMQK